MMQQDVTKAGQIAALQRTQVPGLRTASVTLTMSDTDLALKTEDGEEIFARQAGSCLLAPAVGDKVLVYAAGEDAFVLAVLVRAEASRTPEVAVPGASSLKIAAQDELELSGKTLRFKAGKLAMLTDVLAQSAGAVTLHAKSVVETIAEKFSSTRTLTVKAENRTTTIEKTDTVSAGTRVQKVEGVSLQNSEITLINAKQDVRVDGERISLG